MQCLSVAQTYSDDPSVYRASVCICVYTTPVYPYCMCDDIWVPLCVLASHGKGVPPWVVIGLG